MDQKTERNIIIDNFLAEGKKQGIILSDLSEKTQGQKFTFDLGNGIFIKTESDPEKILALVKIAANCEGGDGGPRLHYYLLNLVTKMKKLENKEKEILWRSGYSVKCWENPDQWIKLHQWFEEMEIDYSTIFSEPTYYDSFKNPSPYKF